jgi:hypothetical protein
VKTISLKKVSAVAVASLGFGLLSVVPAQAAALTSTTVAQSTTVLPATSSTIASVVFSGFVDSTADTIAVSAPTGPAAGTITFATVGGGNVVTAGSANVITVGTAGTLTEASDAFGLVAAAATAKAVVATVSRPGTYTFTLGGSGTITIVARSLAYTTGDGTPVAPFSAGNGIAGINNTVTVTGTSTQVANVRALVTVDGAGATIVSGTNTPVIAADFKSATIGAASDSALVIKTPTAGTVTVSLFNETAASSGLFSSTASNTVTITVGTAAVAGGINTATSTAVMNAAATWSSTTEATVTASRTASTTPVAAIKVTLAQTAGAITTTTPVTASITGSGSLYLNDNNDHTNSVIGAGRSLSSTIAGINAETFYVMVNPDGTSGVGTVTITAGTYTATKTVTFYGSAATYKATTQLVATANAVTTTDAVVVCATDSAGIAVPSSTIYAYSGDATVATVETSDSTVSSAVTAESGTIPTSFVAKKAVGCVGFDVTGLSQTTKSSVVLTFGNAATQATSTVTTTATVNVGSVAATTVAVGTNKATYAPGEKMTVTLTFKDSAGRLVAAGPGTATLAAALTSSTSLTGDALFGTANATKDGTIAITVYAPLAQGPVVFTGTTGAAGTYIATLGAALAITATATVVDTNQTSLLTQIDALNAKIVALNALIAKIMKKLGVK